MITAKTRAIDLAFANVLPGMLFGWGLSQTVIFGRLWGLIPAAAAALCLAIWWYLTSAKASYRRWNRKRNQLIRAVNAACPACDRDGRGRRGTACPHHFDRNAAQLQVQLLEHLGRDVDPLLRQMASES